MSELLKLNVNDHVERKNGQAYLSWSWAWSEVLRIDPQATWEAVEKDGLPVFFFPDQTAMVQVRVTIKGHTKACWLPVMNHMNKAIKSPDAFAVNTAMVRCLTKCISMHGLGLYIYAGEGMPEVEPVKKQLTPQSVKAWENAKRAFARDGNLDKVLSVMDMSEDHQAQLIAECTGTGDAIP